MTNSQFCIRQREKEQQRLNKLLLLGFVGSAAIHGILAYALTKWSFEPPERAEEPMELVLVDRPKPEPKIESEPVVEPEPVKPPEPVQAQAPPPPTKPPEPVQAQTPPPKPAPEPTPKPNPQPAPKQVLTTPTPAPSQPIVPAPVENSQQSSSLSSNFTSPNNTANSESSASSSTQPGGSGSTVATNSAPPLPQTSDRDKEGISCVSNCQPEYPAALEGVEGSAGVKLTINPSGNVISAELIDPNSNSGVNRQALLAARRMRFSSPGNNNAAVRVSIDFTVAGSEYDRARRAEQRRRERAERERREQEAARQRQLEAERQAQQEQLERERQARQEQQERERQAQQQQQQQQPTPAPIPTQPAAQSAPPPLNNEVDDEMLQKFRERIEQHQHE